MGGLFDKNADVEKQVLLLLLVLVAPPRPLQLVTAAAEPELLSQQIRDDRHARAARASARREREAIEEFLQKKGKRKNKHRSLSSSTNKKID